MPKRRKSTRYSSKKFRNFVEELLSQRDESRRQASMAAGIDGTSISRYFDGTQPMRDACIALADHFGINPNEMLQVAGYEPLHFFDRRLTDPGALPPDVEQLNGEIMAIEDDEVRREVVEALRGILHIQQEMQEKVARRVLEGK